MSQDTWQRLRAGEPDALLSLKDAYCASPDASEAMELGVAYLWLKMFPQAFSHFLDAAEKRDKRRGTMSTFNEMAGTAKWCMNQAVDAVAEWRTALAAQYTDWAGGIAPALLICFASALRPDVISDSEAVDLLDRRIKNKFAGPWPTPIALFLLGAIDENELYENGVHEIESATVSNRWQAGFYVGVMAYKEGNVARFSELMAKTTETSDEDFDENSPNFLAKLWAPEFFLARHEVTGESGQEKGTQLFF